MSDIFTLIEQVTDALLSAGDVMVMDMEGRFGLPDLMVLATNRMPVFLYIKPTEEEAAARKVYIDQLEAQKAAWFTVDKIEDIDFLLDTIHRLRKAGEIRQPKTAASEGFEQQRTAWMD